MPNIFQNQAIKLFILRMNS